MSQQTTNSKKYVNKYNKKNRGWLLIFSYAILFGIIAFILSFALASLIEFGESGEYIAAQLLQQFGYISASKALAKSSSFNLRASQRLSIVISLIATSVGAIYGYLKGKNML